MSSAANSHWHLGVRLSLMSAEKILFYKAPPVGYNEIEAVLCLRTPYTLFFPSMVYWTRYFSSTKPISQNMWSIPSIVYFFPSIVKPFCWKISFTSETFTTICFYSFFYEAFFLCSLQTNAALFSLSLLRVWAEWSLITRLEHKWFYIFNI